MKKAFIKTWGVLTHTIGAVCVLLIVNSSWAASIDELVEKFLATNQEIAVDYFRENQRNVNNALNCFEKNRSCSLVSLEAGTDEKPATFQLDKSQLAETIIDQYANYRLVVGLSRYKALQSALKLGRGQASISPLKSLGTLIYETQSDEGLQEIETIEAIYNDELSGIRDHNIWLEEHSITNIQVESTTMNQFFLAKAASLVHHFPFFAYLTRPIKDQKDLVRSLKKLQKSYATVSRKVASLQRDERYEIFGFIEVFKRALVEFTKEDIHRLQQHFLELQEGQTFLKKIKAVILNPHTLFMIGCFSFSAMLTPTGAAPIVGLICGSVGMAFAIPGIANSLQQTLRMLQYLSTGEFDHSVFSQYIVSNTIAITMYSIWAKAAIPSFTRNLSGLKKNIAATLIIRQMNGRFVNVDRSTLSGAFASELQFLKNYLWFNGRELGMDATIDSITHLSGFAGSTIPAATTTFLSTVQMAQSREPSLFFFTDLLKISRDYADIR